MDYSERTPPISELERRLAQAAPSGTDDQVREAKGRKRIPEELHNFRITAFNEIKDVLNQKFSNDVKYFGGFLDNTEYDRFIREITLRLINLAQDINACRLQKETY